MDTLDRQITTRALRDGLSDVVSRVAFGHERVGITRNGKLTAVLVDVDDFATLERLEDAADVAAYDEATAEDDGTRYELREVAAELGL
ncbi:type II toxin-antitoxin system prevent-host-death family antitoxin [Isoptericola dokdonensis]|jgi:prevent-host-death family protein|uniref:Antitoxin n=1 Tax=Isoptericola dokdonensis DS-3 TaxID=1300344 RepID=A0A161I2I9_9MICO|nr:type II toxin-antitoxin system prevent-host-death family antitoxin [Isoptericola dokdonensis]ANC31885.1 Antitoxin RelB [Isoptericola dokdonensis DS-3]